MAKRNLSTKRLQINDANTKMVLIIAAASFVTVFSIVASRALWIQQSYQSRVIDAKEGARNQLRENLVAADQLVGKYQEFVSTPVNMLGGNPVGTGERDGDNAKLALDALPSKYDFPALTASVEKLLTDRNFGITSIMGIDDEVTQASAEPTPTPVPIEIPFEFTVTGNYPSIQGLVQTFERSIRPFQVMKLSFTGSDNELELTTTAKSYYQPEKSLNVHTKVVE